MDTDDEYEVRYDNNVVTVQESCNWAKSRKGSTYQTQPLAIIQAGVNGIFDVSSQDSAEQESAIVPLRCNRKAQRHGRFSDSPLMPHHRASSPLAQPRARLPTCS